MACAEQSQDSARLQIVNPLGIEATRGQLGSAHTLQARRYYD